MNAPEQLARVATALGEFNEQVVFVGGATVDLYITDPAAGPPRFTEDVDIIVDVRTRADYHFKVEKALRAQGFREDMREDAPICRWVRDDIVLDAMPIDATILGFTNRWYEDGFASAQPVELKPGTSIRILQAPYLLATKLEAFKGRGRGDLLASADIEDIIRLVDGRPVLKEEVEQAGRELSEYLVRELASLLGLAAFADAVPAHLLGDAGSQARVGLVLQRLRNMCEA